MKIVMRPSNKISEYMFISDATFAESDFESEESLLEAFAEKSRASISRVVTTGKLRSTSVALPGGKRLCPIVNASNQAYGRKLLNFLSPSFPSIAGFRESSPRHTGNGDNENFETVSPLGFINNDNNVGIAQSCSYLVPKAARAPASIVSPSIEVKWEYRLSAAPGTIQGQYLRSGVQAAASPDIYFSLYSYGYSWIEVSGNCSMGPSDKCITFLDARVVGAGSRLREPRAIRYGLDGRAFIVGKEDLTAALNINSGYALTYNSRQKVYEFVQFPVSLGGPEVTEGMYYDVSITSEVSIGNTALG